MKGILLAGGSGTRLHPLTVSVSKQLLPVYDKPMIYYPISVLLLAGVKEILIISTPDAIGSFKQLLGDGSELGIRFEYRVQPEPEGIAQALLIGEEFLAGGPCVLILGDNLFFGHNLQLLLSESVDREKGATIFAYHVSSPKEYGVVEIDEDDQVLSIEEKPDRPKSSWAATGLYFYDKHAVEYAKSLVPSARGELEISDLNRLYLDSGELYVKKLGRGYAWLDAGTHSNLLEASQFVSTLEHRQGLKIACLEEIVFNLDYIDDIQLTKLGNKYGNSSYGKYVLKLASGETS